MEQRVEYYSCKVNKKIKKVYIQIKYSVDYNTGISFYAVSDTIFYIITAILGICRENLIQLLLCKTCLYERIVPKYYSY